MQEDFPIEIDRDEQKITVVDDRRLYEFIEKGAAIRLLPIFVSAGLNEWIPEFDFITRVLEATLVYYAGQYTIAFSKIASIRPGRDTDKSAI